MAVDPSLLEVIACPLCLSGLSEKESSLDCSGCGLSYPIVDDIPVLLIDEAQVPEGKTLEEIKSLHDRALK